jgi:hypothetical protein
MNGGLVLAAVVGGAAGLITAIAVTVLLSYFG